MARPALIIGIGGTGQWVLTHLKKDLFESNQGRLPENVRLLCFDTRPRADVASEGASASGNQAEKEVKVGSIKLEDKEYKHLGGKVYELSNILCNDTKSVKPSPQYAHLESWFQSCYWLKNLPEASFNLSEGAGQLRQFGRMALFHDVQDINQSVLLTSMRTAIDELNVARNGQQIEIIIIGSFAGGTGSGLFIDIALLARHVAAAEIPKLMRGYFVLPRAFASNNTNDDMLARTFAAWRELNRFMVVNEDFSVPKIVYNTAQDGVQINRINTKLFDTCYLVDGVRGNASLATEAELGTHPTIAAAISAILDEKAGGKYTEWAANLAPEYAARINQGRALYSTVGTYTYKVPVYYAQQDFAHKFTTSWLNKLLKPIYDDPQNPDRITRVDSTSPLDPTRTGRMDAFVPLTSTQENEGVSEAPTIFYNEVARIASLIDDTKDVESYAKGEASSGGKSWRRTFTDLRDRNDIKESYELIKKESDIKISEAVGRTQKVRDFPEHTKAILDKFIPQHYGFRGTQGQEVRGTYGDALDKCQDAQVRIARSLLELWLQKTLMSGDKSGRIGYALDALEGLYDKLKAFDGFMDKVRRRRQELKPYLSARASRDVAEREMQKYCTQKFLVFFDDPRTQERIDVYFKKEQDVADARRDEILHDSVANTVRDMRVVVEQLRNEVARWVRTLAVGDSTTNVRGLYTELESQRRALQATKSADERLTAVQERLGDLVYPADQEPAAFQRLTEGIKWSLSNGKLQFSIEPADEAPIALDIPSGHESQETYRSLTQRNLEKLEGYAYGRFSQIPEETRIAERLKLSRTQAQLAKDMQGKAEPLFDRQPGVAGSAAKSSELIRISTEDLSPDTTVYIKGKVSDGKLVVAGLEQERRILRNQSATARNEKNLVEVVGSADPHKCTIVRTDDLMPIEFFRAWHQCLAAYLRNQRFSPLLNHNFPAEANAAKYEEKLAKKREQDYKVFQPWVVMLLENPEMLEQFFMCWVRGWIQPKSEGKQNWYELRVPGQAVLKLTPNSETAYSLFQAARFFVLEGKDQTPGKVRSIRPDEIRAAIDNAEEAEGTDAWMNFLSELCTHKDAEGNIIAGRFSREMQDHVKDLKDRENLAQELPKGEPGNYEQAYADLADVATLMFEERCERKEIQIRQQAGRRPAPPPPVN